MLRLVIRICQLVLHTSFVCDIRARRVWHNFHFHRSRRREAQRELCTFAFIEGAFAENLAELDDTLMIFNNFVIKGSNTGGEKQMADYIEIEQALEMPGLRLVLIPGLPGPWGEAAKGIFHIKKVPFVRVRHKTGDPDYLEALKKWTGQTSYPVATYNDDRPRTTWTDILFLAERIAPQPPLIPGDPEERAVMFGYSHELCGELGLSWCQRLMLLDETLSANAASPRGLPIPNREAATHLGRKYGYDSANAAAAPARIAQIMRLFASRLAQRRAGGHRFLVGDQLSALDIYWATFISRIQPLQRDLCPMPEQLRASFIEVLAENPLIKAAMDPTLLTHRDFVYRNYLQLPVDL